MFKIQESKTKTLFLFIILIVLIIYCNAHPQLQTSSNDLPQNDNMKQDENPKNTTVVQELTSKENLPFLVSIIQHLVPGVHFTIITILYNFLVKVFK